MHRVTSFLRQGGVSIITVALVSLLYAGASFGEGQNALNASQGLRQLAGTDSERNVRKAIAEQLLAYFRQIDQSIPSLTPDESSWIATETKAIDGLAKAGTGTFEAWSTRSVNLQRSALYSQSLIKQSLHILQNCAQRAASSDVDARKEMALWVCLAYELLEVGRAWDPVHVDRIRAKFSISGSTLLDGETTRSTHILLSQEILSNIVAPYFSPQRK